MKLKECEIEGMSYYYGTKLDLFEVCREKIKETIDEYSVAFISTVCGMPRELEEALFVMQDTDSKEAIIKLIEKRIDFDLFVEACINEYGYAEILTGMTEVYEVGEYILVAQ